GRREGGAAGCPIVLHDEVIIWAACDSIYAETWGHLWAGEPGCRDARHHRARAGETSARRGRDDGRSTAAQSDCRRDTRRGALVEHDWRWRHRRGQGAVVTGAQ